MNDAKLFIWSAGVLGGHEPDLYATFCIRMIVDIFNRHSGDEYFETINGFWLFYYIGGEVSDYGIQRRNVVRNARSNRLSLVVDFPMSDWAVLDSGETLPPLRPRSEMRDNFSRRLRPALMRLFDRAVKQGEVKDPLVLQRYIIDCFEEYNAIPL